MSNQLPIEVFLEDTNLQKEGAYLYPLGGDEGMGFIVPRAAGFEFEKQILEIQNRIYGVYHDGLVDRSLINAIWLGENVQGWTEVYEYGKKRPLKFSRENCRALFNNEGYRNSLVYILMSKAANHENYLVKKGREAIAEGKKL